MSHPAPGLSILVPFYDEAHTLETVVTRALGADTLGRSREVILIDDGSADYPALLAPFAEGADVVHGSRFQRPDGAAGVHHWQRGGNWLLTRLANLLSGFSPSDMETGYKVPRRALLAGVPLRSPASASSPSPP